MISTFLYLCTMSSNVSRLMLFIFIEVYRAVFMRKINNNNKNAALISPESKSF